MFLIYHAHMYSHIYSSIIFWGSHEIHLIRIFRIQKRALRTIKRLSNGDSCKPLFSEFNLLTIPSLYIFCCIMYRKLHQDKFILNSQIHQYNTRNKSKSITQKHDSTFFEKSPHYNSAKLFNYLPRILRDINNVTLFKNLLKKILISKVYYDIDSFYNNDTKITDPDVYKFISKKDIEKNSDVFA
jgi:hypothetical protein